MNLNFKYVDKTILKNIAEYTLNRYILIVGWLSH